MLSSEQVAQNYAAASLRKAALPSVNVLILGFFAGMFIALAGASAAIASAAVPNASAARMVSALVFPLGLVMVVLTGSELFTGNSLMILPLLDRRITIGALIKNFVLVYLGNLLGSLFVVLIFGYSRIFEMYEGALAQYLLTTAATKVSLLPMEAFLRGIPCNILVCVAVLAAGAAAEVSGKIMALYAPIVLFVLCGFEHCIANMFYIPAGLLIQAEYAITAEGLTLSGFLLGNLVPVTLGNLVGGMLVVGSAYWFLYLRNAEA